MKTIAIITTLSSLCVFPSFGQIAQTRPDLCGKPDGVIPLPPNITASVDRSSGRADLLLLINDAAPVKIRVPGGVDELDELCPVSDGRRVVLFGTAGHTTNINVIDQANGALLDSFYGTTPLMSPNQRWLVYRKFSPAHTDLPVSEEYLLYDLSKNAAQNRQPQITASDRMDVGAPIFPKGQKNLVLDQIGVPEDQQHEFRSDSFFWAPDSSAVAFADSVKDHLAIVLVTIDGGGNPSAYVHAVPISEVCSGEVSMPDTETLLEIREARVVLEGNGHYVVQVESHSSDSACVPKTLQLHLSDFSPAKAETHEPTKFTFKSVQGR